MGAARDPAMRPVPARDTSAPLSRPGKARAAACREHSRRRLRRVLAGMATPSSAGVPQRSPSLGRRTLDLALPPRPHDRAQLLEVFDLERLELPVCDGERLGKLLPDEGVHPLDLVGVEPKGVSADELGKQCLKHL